MQVVKDVLYSISIINVVDIGIISLLLYLMLGWIQATRAFQILASIIGIGLFYFVADALGLVLVSVLFQYLWAAIIIVLVIVFQPEIRDMLDKASPMHYLPGRKSNDVAPDLIEETVNAVTELARSSTGALIVFRRMDRLDNVVLKGTLLDSYVSAEALLMIFQKGSPLHDGAVLIHRDRIKAASCILPLSTDKDLSSQYGTRHRAAIGLSERSDALCVVVSEERGDVSVVERKEITTYRKKAEFRQALETALVQGKVVSQVSSEGLGSLFRSNWRLKALSVAAAVLLWFVAVGPKSSEGGISVPIQYTNLPAGMEITGPWMDRIDVRVRGSEKGLANLGPGSVRAVVDLSGVVTGLNFLRITPKHIQVPPGVKIAQIRPSDLHLNVEASTVKRLNVVPTIVGNLPENSKLAVTPSEVRIRATNQELTKLKSVTTEPVKTSDLVARGKVVVPVTVKPEGLDIDSIDPLQVTVGLEVPEK
ncbi:MAG: TIGR00159 family protein [Deltaproteobacteria bacterium]|nr:TIGR00159 family protein [Deltaproteobacteria bacterium]